MKNFAIIPFVMFLFGCTADDSSINNIETDIQPVTISLFEISEKSPNSIVFIGKIEGDRSQLSDFGILYSNSETLPTTINSNSSSQIEFGTAGNFIGRIDNLEEGTIYFTRFFMKNLIDEIIYSNVEEVRTVGWYAIGDFPGPVRAASGYFNFDDVGYVFNGTNQQSNTNNDALGDLWKYNNTTKEWTELNTSGFPFTRAYGFRLLENIGNFGYAGLYQLPVPGTSRTEFIQGFYRFNLSDESWDELPFFPRDECEYCKSFVADGNIYVVGSTIFDHFMYKYDFSAFQWQQISISIPFDLYAANSVTISYNGNGYIYASGGLSGVNGPNLWVYDSENQNWTLQSQNDLGPFIEIQGAFELYDTFIFLNSEGRAIGYNLIDNQWVQIVSPPLNQLLSPIIFNFNTNTVLGLGFQNNVNRPSIFNLEK